MQIDEMIAESQRQEANREHLHGLVELDLLGIGFGHPQEG